MKALKVAGVAACVVACAAGLAVGYAYWRVHNRTLVEFRIRQNADLILFSDFGEPPQFAMWIEEPDTGRVQTVFVTHRAATGDWEGKLECPAALPGWFAVYRKETGRTGLPRLDSGAPDGVSGATPKEDMFARSVEVTPGSRWLCWIEVNLSADYNEAFRPPDAAEGAVDTDLDGQPSILYRAEVAAAPGTCVTPELYGYVDPGNPKDPVVRDLTAVTTAASIFESLEVAVVRPNPKLAGR